MNYINEHAQLPHIRYAQHIIRKYVDNKCPQRPPKDSKVIVTDVSTSSICWVEDNVVFEHYYMHPNVEVVMHQHPFANQTIHLAGLMQGYAFKVNLDNPWLTDDDYLKIGNVYPPHTNHGFRIGPVGAQFINIQIHTHDVTNPKSATELYIGHSLGPIHQGMLNG